MVLYAHVEYKRYKSVTLDDRGTWRDLFFFDRIL